jgi:excisionase family DNA binding protein
MTQFFTPAEAAEILHYSRPTISLKIKSGEIPAVRPSGKLRGRVLIPASYFEGLAAAAMEKAAARGGRVTEAGL